MGSKSQRGLNVPVFFKTLLVLSLLAGVSWVLHRFQYRRIVANLDSEAREEIAANDHSAAVELLQRLISLEPKRYRDIVQLADSYHQMHSDAAASLPQIIDRQVAYDTAALSAIEMDSSLGDRTRDIQERLVEKNLQSLRLDTSYRMLASMAGKDPDPWIQKKAGMILLASRLSGGNPPVIPRGGVPNWFVNLREQHPIDLLLACHASDPSDVEVVSTLANIVTRVGATEALDGSVWGDFSAAALTSEVERIVDVLVDASPGEDSWMLRASLVSRSPTQRKQDLEKVLEESPDHLNALRSLVQIQIDAKKARNEDPNLVLKSQDVDSIIDRIEKMAPDESSENVLLRGQWIAAKDGPEQAVAYWEGQDIPLDRPLPVLNAMMNEVFEQKNQEMARTILNRMKNVLASQQNQRVSQAEMQQSNWIVATAEARIAYEEGNIEKATRLLEQAGIGGSAESRKVQWMRMAEGYRRMGLHEKALEAIQRAAQIDPTDPRIRLALADQLATEGNLSDSINALKAIEPKGPQEELLLAGLLLQSAKQMGPDSVDWGLFEQSCRRARGGTAESGGSIETWRLDLLELEASYLRQQLGTGKTLQELVWNRAKEISDANPESLACQETLIDSSLRWFPESSIQPFIDRIASIDADHPRVLIHRFNVALKAGESEAVADLEKAYRENPDNRIQNRLILYAVQRGVWDDVDRYVSLNAATTPMRESDLARICELLLANPPKGTLVTAAQSLETKRKEWLDLIAKYDQRLEAMDSGFGFNWRWLRLRRLFESGNLEAKEAKEAGDLLAKIESLRPNWDGLFALRARLAELRNDNQRAIDAYTIAWNRNSLPDNLISRYMMLLNKEGKQAELNKVLEKMNQMGRGGTPSDGLSGARVGNDAEEMIDTMIRMSPSDPMGYLLKYRLLMARASSSEGVERMELQEAADAELLSAVRIADNSNAAVFAAQIQRAHEKGSKEEVYSIIDRVTVASAIPKADRFSLIGQSYSLLGRLPEAIKAFQQAIEAGGPRFDLLMRIADSAAIFGDTQLALSSLRQLAADYPNNLFFRQRLVQFLGFLNLPETWDEVRKILGVTNLEGSDESKYQFALLALGYGEATQLNEAIQLLESSSLLSSPKNPAQVLLGRLLIRKAKSMFLEGQPSQQIEAVYLEAANRILESKNQDAEARGAAGFLFSALMMEKRYALAESFSTRMGSLAGSSAEVIASQARLASVRENSSDRIASLIDGFVDSLPEVPQAQSELQEGILLARTHLLVGDTVKGERMLRRTVEQFPEVLAVYAIATAASGDEATLQTAHNYLDTLCEKNAGQQELGALISFLSRTKQFDHEIPVVLERLKKRGALIPDGGDLRLKLAWGNLLTTKGRAEEGAMFLEECRRINPLDPLLVNNHAMILAGVDGRVNDAVKLASRYVPDDVFDLSEWQDSLGYALLASGQTKAALNVLKSAASKSNSPLILLHLATALLEAGEQSSAIQLAEGIIEKELHLELLSPSESKAWERLKGLRSEVPQ